MDVETVDYLRFLFAFGLVIGLILGMAWLLRRYASGIRMAPAPGQTRRLSIVETRQLDPRNRLILVRRDDQEHLILLGPGQGLLIEGGIDAPAAPPREQPTPPSNVRQALFRPPPKS